MQGCDKGKVSPLGVFTYGLRVPVRACIELKPLVTNAGNTLIVLSSYKASSAEFRHG